MTKVSREKKYYFSDILPLIVGVIVFATLVVSLIFVVNYDVKKLAPEEYDPQKDIVQEQKVNEDKLTCGKDLIKDAEKINIGYKFESFFIETTEYENSIGGNEGYEDIYNDIAVVILDHFDNEKFEAVIKDAEGNTYNLIPPEEGTVYAENNAYGFKTAYTKNVLTYTAEIKSRECGDVVRRLEITPPIYNIYSTLLDCFNYPEFKWCSKYTFETIPSMDAFSKKINEYKHDLKAGKITTSTTHKNKGEFDTIIYTSEYTTNKNGTTAKTTKKAGSKDNDEDKKEKDLNAIDLILMGTAGVIVLGTIVFIVLRRRNGK